MLAQSTLAAGPLFLSRAADVVFVGSVGNKVCGQLRCAH